MYFLNITEEFVPPKPNEFDIAAVICDNTTMHKILSFLSIIALSGAIFAADVNVQTLSADDDLAAAVAAAKAGISGHLKNHRTGKTVLRKLDFSRALPMEPAITQNSRMAVSANTL